MRYKTCACGGSNKKCKVCSGWGIFTPAQNVPARSSKKRVLVLPPRTKPLSSGLRCPCCDARPNNLYHHWRDFHREQLRGQITPVTCPVCNSVINTCSLNEHLAKHHDSRRGAKLQSRDKRLREIRDTLKGIRRGKRKNRKSFVGARTNKKATWTQFVQGGSPGLGQH